jgi:hypothetical protein
MARYYGYSPKGTVKSAVESFESRTQILGAGGMLLGTVYVDISDEEWAVAIAYGRAHHPGLRGPEPVYEVRYAYRPEGEGGIKRLDTREETPCAVSTDTISSADEFVIRALSDEKKRIGGTGL